MANKKINTIFIVILVSFGHFWHDIFTAFVTPLLPVIKENFNLNYIQAGWILVAVKLPSLLSAPIAGFTEKHNPKWLIILCPLLTSISVTILGNAGSFPVVMVLVFIAGLSAAGFHVPAPTMLKGIAPNRIGMAMTSFQIGGEAARTVGPMLIVPLLYYLGFSKMYLIIPVSLLVSFLFYLSFNKADYAPQYRVKKKGSVIETFKEGWLLFTVVALISLQKSFLSTIMKSFLPLYLQSKGESLLVSTGSLSIVQGATVAGVITAGFLIDKIGPKKIICTIVSVSIVLVLLITKMPDIPFIPMIILLGFFSFASMPAIYTLIQNYGFKFPTTANGVFMSLNFGISSITLLVAGWLSDYYSIDQTYQMFGLLTLVGLPIVILLGRIRK